MRSILLIILLLIILTKSFLLGNYVIHVNINENYDMVKEVENSSIGIGILLNVQNFTVKPQYFSQYVINSTYLLVPYYLAYNMSFSIIYNNYYANITITSVMEKINVSPISVNFNTHTEIKNIKLDNYKIFIIGGAMLASIIAYILLKKRENKSY
ncbi:MAG: hypothetical protein RRA45_06485 [Saccharolobus sp.]|uniref:hypothetical protein n=1 Tax=Saccharolobus sp. TaxID=2100761 RepID=UPI0028CDE9D5|nr:hypothetical protein [Saccharolobus sp.]MDT7861843.1 hypothetical protein [Saccharolobus sp.]